VLFRAGEPLEGIEKMTEARGIVLSSDRDAKRLTSGPGNLSQALGITRERDNGKDLTSAASDLVVLDDGFRPSKIVASVRIGITKAAERPLRYFLAGNRFVSGPRVL
jgi:DNA-3-methyladenine glycosylase